MKNTHSTFLADLFSAGSAATLLGGLPSTLYALWTGGDPLEAIRAAGTMIVAPDSSATRLFAAAVLVHCAVSFFWAAVLIRLIPRTCNILCFAVAAALIGEFDLQVIGRHFAAIAALPFWPQLADHALWGTLLGGVLLLRRTRKRNG